MEQPGEQGPAAGEAPMPRPGAGLLDQDEAVALAGLLEELAGRHRQDPLSGPVLRAAALLRRRVAAGRQGTGRSRSGSEARREAGDTRDDAAGCRDAQAAQRDRLASDRNDRARERDRQADATDEQASASEQRIRDRLWDAGLRGQAAARPAGPALAGGDAGWRQGPPGGDEAGAVCAIQSGFPEDRARDIVFAVHELAANTIVHDGQAGRLRVWELSGALHCQVDDGDLMRSLEELASRDGMTGIRSSRAWDSASVNSLPCEPGHGLAVVRQLADQAQSLSSPRGTSILITFGLHS